MSCNCDGVCVPVVGEYAGYATHVCTTICFISPGIVGASLAQCAESRGSLCKATGTGRKLRTYAWSDAYRRPVQAHENGVCGHKQGAIEAPLLTLEHARGGRVPRVRGSSGVGFPFRVRIVKRALKPLRWSRWCQRLERRHARHNDAL